MCRNAFYSIHSITEKRVRTAIKEVTVTGTVETDQRGKRPPLSKMSDVRCQTVIEHINKLPTGASHYSRAKSPHRKYLPTGLNIAQLYTPYRKCVAQQHPDLEPVVSSYYRQVFNSDLNIGFEPPKSD